MFVECILSSTYVQSSETSPYSVPKSSVALYCLLMMDSSNNPTKRSEAHSCSDPKHKPSTPFHIYPSFHPSPPPTGWRYPAPSCISQHFPFIRTDWGLGHPGPFRRVLPPSCVLWVPGCIPVFQGHGPIGSWYPQKRGNGIAMQVKQCHIAYRE